MADRHFDDWIKAYTQYTQNTEAPLQFHIGTAISTIAGALKRRVWIDQRTFQWTPNFYIILVAPPGIISKTTTIALGEKLLREVPGVHFGPRVTTWQSLISRMAAVQELVPSSDMFYPMAAMSLYSGELGNLYDPSNRDMTDAFVSLWDSSPGAFDKTTKKSGDDYVDTPCLNLIACTTPATIRERFPTYFINGGLASRCIFIYGEKKRSIIAYPGLEREHDPDMERKLIEDLISISQLFGEYNMTPDAIDWGRKWYGKLWTEGEDNSEVTNNKKFAGYRSRKQTHIHKLAMIRAASKRDELIITLEDLIESHATITSLELMMAHVFEFIGITEETRGVDEILQAVKSSRRITRRELYTQLHLTLGPKQFAEALQGAIDTGHIKYINDLVDGNVIVWNGSKREAI